MKRNRPISQGLGIARGNRGSSILAIKSGRSKTNRHGKKGRKGANCIHFNSERMTCKIKNLTGEMFCKSEGCEYFQERNKKAVSPKAEDAPQKATPTTETNEKHETQKIRKKNECKHFNRNRMECKKSKERKTKICNTANCPYFEPIAKEKEIAPVQNENTTQKNKIEKDTTQKTTKQATTPKNENKNTSRRVPRDCIHCNDKTLICQKVKSEFHNITCRPRNCKDFTPKQMPQFTAYALTYQAGTHERSNEYIGVSKNVGTAMHVGCMKSNEATKRRKTKCEFYNKDFKYCEVKKITCPGSARCNSYREKIEN